MRQALVPALVPGQALEVAQRGLVALVDAGDVLAHGLQLFAERAVDDVLNAVRAVGEHLGDEDV